MRCSICSKGLHQKCSTRPKALTCDSHWKCDRCNNLQQNHAYESTDCQLPGSTNSSPSEPLPATSWNKLKIYQWNTDGIRPKLMELRDLLINSDIHILAVQESKLRKTDKTPLIESYTTIHKDWYNILGAGLLIFIHTDIVFKKFHSVEKAGMEILSIRLKATKWTRLELYNEYLSNTPTQHTSFKPFIHSFLVTSMVTLKCGTLLNLKINVVMKFWLDPWQWYLHILNDGSATRTSQITGNNSTPNISLCGSNWSLKTSWSLAEPIGSSDHLPIIIELNHKICYKPVIPKSARWRRNGVDWSCFTNKVESKMTNVPHEPNLSFRVSHFNEILISSATTQLRKSKPSKNSKPWMTPHVQAKICPWNCLCQTIHQNRQEWTDTCHEDTEAINEAKSESWKEILQDRMSNSNGPNMWKVIQGLKGTPDANSPNKAMSHNVQTITDIKSKTNVFINHYP